MPSSTAVVYGSSVAVIFAPMLSKNAHVLPMYRSTSMSLAQQCADSESIVQAESVADTVRENGSTTSSAETLKIAASQLDYEDAGRSAREKNGSKCESTTLQGDVLPMAKAEVMAADAVMPQEDSVCRNTRLCNGMQSVEISPAQTIARSDVPVPQSSGESLDRVKSSADEGSQIRPIVGSDGHSFQSCGSVIYGRRRNRANWS